MSRHRHKMRAKGGLSSKPEWEAGGQSNAAKEAMEKKRGGKVHHHAEGEEAKHHLHKRKRGGHVHHHGHGSSSHHAHGAHGHTHSMHIHHHKKGGKAHKHGGDVEAPEIGTRARGGLVTHHPGQEGHDGAGNHAHEIHSVKHHSMKHTRHGRARGGRIGADKAPLTTAAKIHPITPGETPVAGELDLKKSEHSIKG